MVTHCAPVELHLNDVVCILQSLRSDRWKHIPARMLRDFIKATFFFDSMTSMQMGQSAKCVFPINGHPSLTTLVVTAHTSSQDTSTNPSLLSLQHQLRPPIPNVCPALIVDIDLFPCLPPTSIFFTFFSGVTYERTSKNEGLLPQEGFLGRFACRYCRPCFLPCKFLRSRPSRLEEKPTYQ